jgi:hypothetical protein
MRSLLYFFLATFFLVYIGANTLCSQTEPELITGDQNPFKVKWYQIKTPQFTIIFPKEIERDAQRVANTLNHVYPFVSETSSKIKPLNVVLQSNLAESNGFATLVPRRMEFYNTPPQNSFAGTVDWYSLLSVHELRHITQFSRCNRGFTKFINILFGNYYSMPLMMVAMPGWFFEGDAVVTETALTNSGRGRLPQFNVEMRSLLFAGKRYSYEKVFFGSYKNWYPLDAPYSMGYQYMSFLRRTYGMEAVNKMVKKGSGMSWNPYAFSWAMRKATGYTPYYNYKLMLNDLDTTWKRQIDGLIFTDAVAITKPQKNNWTYNNFGKYTRDGKIIVCRYGQEDIYQFVSIDAQTQEEQQLYSSYFMSADVPFSVSGDTLVWAETKNDIRWGNRSYSNIKILDISTGKEKTLTEKSKFFAPAIDPSGIKIIAVEYDNKNLCSLVLLNAETGEEIQRFPNPDNELMQTPVWMPDGKNIVFIKMHAVHGKALCILNIETGLIETIIDYSHENISCPVSDGKYIYYGSPFSGIDNIYAISIASKEKFQVTSRKFGAYYPSVSPDGKKLLFSDATDQGYLLMEMPLDEKKWIPLDKVEKRIDDNFNILVNQEQNKSILEDIPNKKYSVSKYRGSSPFRNAYSWNFLSFPPNINLMVQTQNPLSSFGTAIAYKYNMNEYASSIDVKTSYAGFYPIIDLGGGIGRRTTTKDSTTGQTNSGLLDTTGKYTVSWYERSAYAGLKLPLNLSAGTYSSNLTMSVKAAITEISDLHYPELFKNNNGIFIPVTYSLDYTRETSWLSDMLPVWGQELHLSYAHTPFSGDFNGDMLSAQGFFFFPGIAKHHNLFFEAAYEKQNPDNYRFESKILYPRGYSYMFEEELIKGSVNYTFPIAYPDFSFIHTIYFKRLAANLFYDYGMANYNEPTFYRSTGAELKSETFLFHIPIPFIFGLRGSYLFDSSDNYKVEGFFALGFK